MSRHFLRPLFHLAVVVVFSTVSISNAQDSKRKLLRWSDVKSKQSIRAYFDGLENGIVKLKTKDGERYSITVERLSPANQRFIKNLPAESNDQADPENDDGGQVVPNNNARQQVAQPIEDNRGVSKNMYGIRWEPMEALLTDQPVAAAENKPVFWFRVLGDLEGFM